MQLETSLLLSWQFLKSMIKTENETSILAISKDYQEAVKVPLHGNSIERDMQLGLLSCVHRGRQSSCLLLVIMFLPAFTPTLNGVRAVSQFLSDGISMSPLKIMKLLKASFPFVLQFQIKCGYLQVLSLCLRIRHISCQHLFRPLILYLLTHSVTLKNLYVCVYHIHLCVSCPHAYGFPWRSGERVRYLKARVTADYGLPSVSTGNQAHVLCQSCKHT